MIGLILILLCGVSSYYSSQPVQNSFLIQYEATSQGLPLQKFDELQQFLKIYCNLSIPMIVPKFSYTTINSIPLHLCMGILDTVQRLGVDYRTKKLKEPIDEFFNRTSTIIMNELRNISNGICDNFNNVVLENKKSQWVENLRHHLNRSDQCKVFCIEENDAISEQCVFIYGLHKTLNLIESKNNLQTTTHVASTDSHKSEKSQKGEVPMSPKNNTQQPESKLVQSEPKNPKSFAIVEKSDTHEIPIKEQNIQTNVEQSLQKSEDTGINLPNIDKALSIDNKSQYIPDGVEDSERFQIPSTTSTTAKNVASGSSNVINQRNQLPPKQEFVPAFKPEVEQQPEIGHSEDKPPKPQVQETDFNEYQVPELDDDKDDEEIDKGDGDIVEPKNEYHKKQSINEEEIQKRIQSFGKKPVTAQEVDTEVSLMPWYLMVVFCAFLVYLSFANKKKIVAYVVEGRPSGRYGRRSGRPNTANYRKLDTNLEEAITSNCNTTTSHVIY